MQRTSPASNRADWTEDGLRPTSLSQGCVSSGTGLWREMLKYVQHIMPTLTTLHGVGGSSSPPSHRSLTLAHYLILSMSLIQQLLTIHSLRTMQREGISACTLCGIS